MEKERIEFLVKFLNERTKEYDEGHPTISDKEWDTLYFELKDLEFKTGFILPNSPTQKVIYESVNELTKVSHNHKMLSLDKTKDLSEVLSYMGTEPYLVMCKMDGLTCSLRYLDGKLVSAETRGDGIEGEDILHNARVIPSIPKLIPYYDELIVDGEIICSYDDFGGFEGDYKNPRNFAAGSIRLLDSKECSKRKLQFVAWEVIKGLDFIKTLSGRLGAIREFSFNIVPGLLNSADSPENIINRLKDLALDLSYPIDGLVYKFNNVELTNVLGETEHHLKNAIAYKFYDEEYESELLGIEYQVSRTGIMTPVAVFKTIEMDGSSVNKASLHNLSILEKVLHGKGFIGQKIKVAKMNMIIPQIVSAEENTEGKEEIDFLQHCPFCGQPTCVDESDSGTKVLKCSNEECPCRLINRLENYCGKKGMDIKGLSKSTLEKLIAFGWINKISDLYNLRIHKSEWEKKEGFGIKSVENILTAIEKSKSKELNNFISAIGIPLIGAAGAKQLAKKFSSWGDFRKCLDFSEIEGFGSEMDAAIKNFDYREADFMVAKILNLTNSFWTKEEKDFESTFIKNKAFVVTGKLNTFKNREELQNKIEALGGKVVSSVSKNTDYLINNDIMSESAKNKAAKSLGIPILTEEEFLSKISF